MDEIDKLVKRASWRLTVSAFLSRLSWAAVAAAAAFAAYLLVERLCYLGLSVDLIGAAAACVAIGVAVVLTVAARPSRIHAAIEVDQRAALRSRLATAVDLHDGGSPMLDAVMEDARAHSQQVNLTKSLPIVWPRRALLSLLPVLAVLFLVWAFVPQCDMFGRREKEIQIAKEKEEIIKRAEELKARIERLEKVAQIENLEMAQKLVDEVKATADEMEEANDKAEALATLADMAEDLEAQRAPAEELQRTLESLQGFAEGEITKDMASALKAGDIKSAAQALRKLQEKLKKGELSEKDLQKMAEELQKLSQACKGNKKMSEALDNLAKSLMADKAMALENMKQMLGELDNMAKMAAEMELMDLALQELAMCKGQLTGEAPSLDELCKAYEEAMAGRNIGPGMGGPGVGKGGVSEDGTDAGAQTNKTRIRGQLGEGEILGSIFVRGTPKKGQALVEYSEIARSAKEAATDALSKEEIPPGYKGLIKGYFDSIDPGRIPEGGKQPGEKRPTAGAGKESEKEEEPKP